MPQRDFHQNQDGRKYDNRTGTQAAKRYGFRSGTAIADTRFNEEKSRVDEKDNRNDRRKSMAQ